MPKASATSFATAPYSAGALAAAGVATLVVMEESSFVGFGFSLTGHGPDRARAGPK
ncbi:hypothetical protein GCM10009849_08400 [Sinomonas flava]|uniref:Uncharacterized protein n=1 Tax=Sinomonas flava TaxID=496857 RepID=A0ABN3BMY0_9MICC